MATQTANDKIFKRLVLFSLANCNQDTGSAVSEVCLMAWQVIDSLKVQPATLVEYCYIRPSEPVTQDKVPPEVEVKHLKNAPLINEGLKKLQSIFNDESYCLVTNGPEPLRQYLFPEMSRKCISTPLFMQSYFDITKEVDSDQNPQSLKEVCDCVGVDGPVDCSCGEEEVRVLSSIVIKLLLQGHVFKSPEVINDTYMPATTTDASLLSDRSIVKLKGLPFQAKHDSVAKFLCGLNIIPGGIHFITNSIGRRTGDAVVALENEEQASLALKRDRQYLGKRYIEVSEGTVNDISPFDEGSSDPGSNSDDVFVVRMQGLPYRAHEKDICLFFGDEAPVLNGVNGALIVRYPNGRASGDAFALFATSDGMKRAMEKDKQDMMGRYIELFQSSVKEFVMVLNKSGSPEQLKAFDFLSGVGSSVTDSSKCERKCVQLRGLPWEATAEDVINFFGDLSSQIEQQGVHMVLNAQNRPTGDCYVQMISVDSASKAAERLHKRNMKKRYIEVFQCSGNEVTYALLDSAGSKPYSSHYSGRGRGSGGGKVKARGLPYSAQVSDVVDFFAEFNIFESDIEMVYNRSGKSSGIAFIMFSSAKDAQSAVKSLNNKYLGNRYVELSLV